MGGEWVKVELFHYLDQHTISNFHGQVVTTKDESVLFNSEKNDIINLPLHVGMKSLT